MASTNVAAERWEAAMVMSKVLQRTKTRKSISVKEIAARSRRSDLKSESPENCILPAC